MLLLPPLLLLLRLCFVADCCCRYEVKVQQKRKAADADSAADLARKEQLAQQQKQFEVGWGLRVKALCCV